MAVAVRETGKNRYDMHRIVMPDGSAFVFEQKANTVPTAVGSITGDAYSPGEVHPTISTVSGDSIRQSSENSLVGKSSKLQNQQREPRISDRDVLRMAARLAKNDRSNRSAGFINADSY